MPTDWTSLSTAITLVALVALGVYVIALSRRRQGQRDRAGDALWEDLRKAHGLSRRETKYLKDLASRSALTPESLIFLEPHVLTRLTEKDPESQKQMHEVMSKLYS